MGVWNRRVSERNSESKMVMTQGKTDRAANQEGRGKHKHSDPNAEGVPGFKAEYRMCHSCICLNNYLICSMEDCTCAAMETTFCCFGHDMACLPVPEHIPKTCTCLPGCVVYPTIGCCPTVKDT